MARTDDDTWDLSNSVGATATGVAVGRALASRGPDPLITDPFAEPLVRAVGVNFFTRIASGELDPAHVDDNGDFGMQRMGAMMGVRTRFFDEFFLGRGRRGHPPGGDLGLGTGCAGLPAALARRHHGVRDRPGHRSSSSKPRPWPTWAPAPPPTGGPYPSTFATTGPRRCAPRAVTPAKPTAWSAEGLLPFLPPDAQDRLLDNITALSPAGSQLATENVQGAGDAVQTMADRMREVTDQWREHGFDIEMTDLWYAGDRNDVVDYLDGRGWATSATGVSELAAAYGLSLPADSTDRTTTLGSLQYVTATRN